MENENEQPIDVEESNIEETQQDGEQTDWKAEAEKWRGLANRNKKMLEKLKAPTEEKEVNKSKQNNSLDYGQLAFYNSRQDAVKIEHDEDVKHLQDMMADTGKSQLELLGSKWFQSEMKERQEARTVQDATPSSTNRTQQVNKDGVDYWLSQDKLPEDRELRTKVVNAKIAKAKTANDAPSGAVISSIPSNSGIEIK